MKLKDIAKLANVSTSAVSLAINGKPGISEETRERILKIAREYGYTPKGLIKGESVRDHSNKILRFVACTNSGIVSEKYETLPFFTELIHQIDFNIQSRGYSLMISSIDIHSLMSDNHLLGDIKKSDGIILLGTNLTKEQIEFIAEHQPNIVVIDTCLETMDMDFIVMNNIKGAYDAGRYLIENGHSKIGYVESTTRFYNFDMRKKGFQMALTERNKQLDSNFVYNISPTEIVPQEKFKQRILNSEDLPTALFCECDYMAISVVKSLTDLGIHVPNEISVIGFDNIWESQIIHPDLTTVDVKKDKIASLAVQRLIEIIEGDHQDHLKIFVDTEIVERASTIPHVKKSGALILKTEAES